MAVVRLSLPKYVYIYAIKHFATFTEVALSLLSQDAALSASMPSNQGTSDPFLPLSCFYASHYS